MKIIISSRVAEKLAGRLNNHLKSLQHQPITLELTIENEDEVKIKVDSVEGKMSFSCLVEKIKWC